MPKFPPEDLSYVRSRLLAGVKEYLQTAPDDCNYTDTEIIRCAAIVDAYLEDISKKSQSPQAIREAVKRVVLELNELNKKCAGTLIETDQQEDLCQILQVAANAAGLNSEEDITEQWRDW